MKKNKHILEWDKFDEGEYDVFQNVSGEEYWGDFAAGVLPICTKTGRILVGLRSEYVNEPRTWGIFGGMVDDKKEQKDPALAAMRELEEEAGHAGKDFKVIPAYVFKSKGGGFEYHNFIGLVPEEFNAVLDWETEKAKWVTLSEFKSLRPKHFGLEGLIDNSMDIIERYAR